MLTLAEVQEELSCIIYKKNWSFSAFEHRFEGIVVRIVATGQPDSYHSNKTIDLGIDSFLPPMQDAQQLWEWLAWRLGRIENHEMREFLQIDGTSEPIFNPHAVTE